MTQSRRRTQDRAENETATSPPYLCRLEAVLTQWVQLWADKKLDPVFAEPRIQAKLTGGDQGGGKARPIALEEMLLEIVTSSILRGHISQVQRAAGAYQFGIYHEGRAPEIAWKIHAKDGLLNQRTVFIACDIKNGFGAVQDGGDAIEGARMMVPGLWEQSSSTYGREKKKCNQRRGRTHREEADQSESGMAFCKARAKAPVAFALALRVALATCGGENKVCNQQHGQALQEAADRSQSEMVSCKARARRRRLSRWPCGWL